MIQLEGLTKKQAVIAQLLWDCETEESLLTLIRCLPTREDQLLAKTLVQLMLQEAMEQGIDRYAEVANEVIESLR